MRVLSELEPKNVFSFFEDICNIPHPSYKEEKISNYLVDFAKERKLEYYQDSLYNVIIIKEASKGYEDILLKEDDIYYGEVLYYALRDGFKIEEILINISYFKVEKYCCQWKYVSGFFNQFV